MTANWTNPVNSTTHTDILDDIKDRVLSAVTMSVSGDSNIPTGAYEINSGTLRKYTGSWATAPLTVAALTATTGTFTGDVLPTDDATHTLGSDSYRWTDSYIQRIFKCYTVESNGANQIIGTYSTHSLFFKTGNTERAFIDTDGHFLPRVDVTYKCGTASYRWSEVWTNTLRARYVEATSGVNMELNIDTGYAYRFKINSVVVFDVNATGLIPTTATHALGGSSNVWSACYVDDLILDSNTISKTSNSTITLGTTFEIDALTLVELDIGSVNKVALSTSAFNIGVDIFPKITATNDIGRSDLVFVDVFAANLKAVVAIDAPADLTLTSLGDTYLTTDGSGDNIYIRANASGIIYFGATDQWAMAGGGTGDFGPTGTNGTRNLASTGIRIKKIWAVDIHSTNAVTDDSDERLKTDIEFIDDKIALNRVLALQPFTYKYIEGYGDAENKTKAGFSAQKTFEIIPEAVSPAGNEKEYKEGMETWGICTSQITPYLVGAIQELNKKMEDIKNGIS